MDKKEFSPRLGFAYSWDQKTVIRGGYGIFWIPNYISFGLNPDNDVINLATTPFHATLDQGLTPSATIDASNCTLGAGGFATFTCTTPGPFGPGGILPPPGRNAVPSTSAFVATNGNPTLAPWTNPKPGYVQQYNLDIQRQLGKGFFADIAYAGAHGVHLQQYSTNVNQIPDSFVAQAAAQAAAGQTPTIAQPLGAANPLVSPDPSLQGLTVPKGQLNRPYPQYTGLSLAGFGCCSSNYNSLQALFEKRYERGLQFQASYTFSKSLDNMDNFGEDSCTVSDSL